MRHVLVLTEGPLAHLSPDLAAVRAVAESHRATTFAVVARRDDANLHVRVFVPSAGIAEDPGTGSAAGPIGVLARSEWSTDEQVTIHQGGEIGRPCTIEVEALAEGPVVGGRVAACAEGRFTLQS
jgi:trans-2,3-dihydro-3-hydroxyanthranilate isomerase